MAKDGGHWPGCREKRDWVHMKTCPNYSFHDSCEPVCRTRFPGLRLLPFSPYIHSEVQELRTVTTVQCPLNSAFPNTMSVTLMKLGLTLGHSILRGDVCIFQKGVGEQIRCRVGEQIARKLYHDRLLWSQLERLLPYLKQAHSGVKPE